MRVTRFGNGSEHGFGVMAAGKRDRVNRFLQFRFQLLARKRNFFAHLRNGDGGEIEMMARVRAEINARLAERFDFIPAHQRVFFFEQALACHRGAELLQQSANARFRPILNERDELIDQRRAFGHRRAGEALHQRRDFAEHFCSQSLRQLRTFAKTRGGHGVFHFHTGMIKLIPPEQMRGADQRRRQKHRHRQAVLLQNGPRVFQKILIAVVKRHHAMVFFRSLAALQNFRHGGEAKMLLQKIQQPGKIFGGDNNAAEREMILQHRRGGRQHAVKHQHQHAAARPAVPPQVQGE